MALVSRRFWEMNKTAVGRSHLLNHGKGRARLIEKTLKPFVGGTYFPAKDSIGKLVFKNVLLQVADGWKGRRNEIVASSKEITSQLQKSVQSIPREGAFYVWTKDEIDHALGPDRARVFDYVYGVEAKGNTGESDRSGELGGKNVLIQQHPLGDAAKEFNSNGDQVRQLLDDSRKLLLEARNQRPHPSRDDKVVTSWNGLMISAFARGAQVLNKPGYLKAALQAASFVQTKLYKPNDQTLLHTYLEGESKIMGLQTITLF